MQLKSPVRIMFIFAVFVVVGFFIWSRSPFFNEWMRNQYFGEILTLTDTQITLSSRETGSKTIYIDEQTDIIKGRQEVTRAALATNSAVLVVGEPDEDGAIRAKIIRIFPPRKQ